MENCTMTEKQALKIHGYVFSSDSDISSNSDCGKSEFDEEYYTERPPPVPLQGLENRIVQIKRKTNKSKEGEVPNTSKQENAILEQNNQPKKKKNRRKAKGKTNKIDQSGNSTIAQPLVNAGQARKNKNPNQPNVWNRRGEQNKKEPSRNGNLPKQHPQAKRNGANCTTGQPSNMFKPSQARKGIQNPPNVWDNKRSGQNKNKPFRNDPKQQHQKPPAFPNKQQSLNNIRSTKYTSEWVDLSNSSPGSSRDTNYTTPRTEGGPRKPFTLSQNSFRNEPCTTITSNQLARNIGDTTKNLNRDRVPFRNEQNFDVAATSTHLDLLRSYVHQRPLSRPTAIIESLNKNSYAEVTRITPTQSVSTSNKQDSSRPRPKPNINQTEPCNDFIFTISSPVVERNTEVTLREWNSVTQRDTDAIVNQPISERSENILIIDTGEDETGEEQRTEEDVSVGNCIIWGFKKLFCCKVEENYSHM